MAAGLATVPVASNGLGRFSYALVLPAMKLDFGWSFTVAGTLNTANALGYLSGALGGLFLSTRISSRGVLSSAVVAGAATVLLSGLVGNVWLFVLLRFLGGVAGAIGFIIAGATVTRLTRGHRQLVGTVILSIYFSGPGLGIAVSGTIVPIVIGQYGWRWAWIVLGLCCLALAAVTVVCLRMLPTEIEKSSRTGKAGLVNPGHLRPLFWSYGLFGVGYIAYMTFAVALAEERGFSRVEVSIFWIMLGVTAVVASFLWIPGFGYARSRVRPGFVTMATLVGSIIPLASTSSLALYCSAVVFGGSFLVVTTAVMTQAKETLPYELWSQAVGSLTVFHAAGQCAGPLLAGLLADRAGGLQVGIGVGSASLACACVAARTRRQGRSSSLLITARKPGVDGRAVYTGPVGKGGA